MSEPGVEVVVEPAEIDSNVSAEDAESITLVVEPSLPDIVVDMHEVGLPGPAGKNGIGAEEAMAVIEGHINSPTPHPAYDDGPSFLLLYLNAKV